MAQYKWHKTKHKGLRYREHPTRKCNKKSKQGRKLPDRFYQYRIMIDGKPLQESFGWITEWEKADPEVRKKKDFELHCAHLIENIRESRKTGKGAATFKEKRAEAEKKRKQQEIENITLGQVWEKYLSQVKADRGENALATEIGLYNTWIKPNLGKKPLKEIALIHLEKIKSQMAKANKSPRTVQYVLAVTRQIFNYAKRHKFFKGDNPTSDVTTPFEDNKRIRFLTKAEANELLKELKGRSQPLYEQALLSLHTGMRAGEIFSLKWKDINFDQGMITLWNTKNKNVRPVYLTDTAKNMLQEKWAKGQDPQALVFPGRNGVKIKQVSDSFNRAVDKLGLNQNVTDRREKVIFHTLRHTFASWLVQGGTDLYTVKELLGHKDIKMTQRYSHLAPHNLQAAIKKFDQSASDEPKQAKVTHISAAG